MSGEPNNRQYTDDEFIEAVSQLEPASTPEVASYVGCVEETARLRLIDLNENGIINRKMISHGSVWFID